MIQKLDLEKFRTKFHYSWWEKMKPFFQTQEAYNIYQFLKKESAKGATIFPLSKDTYNAFSYCSYGMLSVVIIGMEPYSTTKQGNVIADGMAFSNSYTGKRYGIQPSLRYFWKGIANDLGYKEYTKEPNLAFLALQGVLLLNTSLTVEMSSIGSHLKLKKDQFPTSNLWEEFQKFLLKEVLGTYTGMVYILMGKNAQSLERYINPDENHIFKTEHPSYAARQENSEWDAGKVFSKTNRVLKDNNIEEIHWIYEDFQENGLPF